MKTDRLYQLTSHLLMAACATFFAGSLSSCYNEDPTDEVPVSGKWQISIPATIDMNADTRVLKYQDDKLTATFSIKDNIYVIKDGDVDSQVLHPDKDDTTANLEGALDGTYKRDDVLTLVYNTKNDGTFSFAKQIGGHVEDGDLNAFDYAVAKVKVTAVNDGKITTTPALFQSLQSMYKFTFVDEKDVTVKVSKLLVSTKNNDLIMAGSVKSSTEEMGSVSTDISYSVDGVANGEVWVALSKRSNASDTFIFDALDEENNLYMGTLDVKDGKIKNGKFYTATITLTKQETDPLTLQADADGTITINNPNGLVISYLKNLDTRVTSTGNIEIAVEKGDVVRFYGDNESYCVVEPDFNYTNIKCSSDCFIYGNIMSLIDSDGYDTATTLTGKYTFMNLFYENEHIKNHDDKPLTLPATTLTESCYSGMFEGCTGLTTAPELPATTLAKGCYEYMFCDCKGLTTAPELPADTLAESCYQVMFQGCSSLETAPALPATTLTENCYIAMFSGCSSLKTAPALPATTLAESCYEKMFSGCENLTTAPELPAETLKESCYYSMFNGCKSLTTAPELPAEKLAGHCYEEMFLGCTGLTTAPEKLPATTLAESCYEKMFCDCKSLTTAPELKAETLAE